MAAARAIPRNEAVWTINFTYDGSTMTVSSPSIIVNSGDEINFVNSSSSAAPINIAFAANPPGVTNPPGPVLFSDVVNLQPGTNNEQATSPSVNGSVNYTVTVAGQQPFGPFAIQVGSGPIYIQITNLDSIPDPIMIPKGGTLEMYSNDSNTYNVKWPAAINPFPGLKTANPGPSNNIAYTEQGPAQGYNYEITVKTMEGVGGGKVIIH